MRSVPLIACTLLAVVGPAIARTPTRAPAVDELVVTGRVRCLPVARDDNPSPPRLVSTFPAAQSVVRPGLLVVRATFDRPMTCGGFFWEAAPFPTPCPQDVQKMVMSLDRQTFRTLCATRANTEYRLRIDPAKPDAFAALNGVEAPAYELRFRTSADPKVRTIPEALSEDAAPRR